MARWAVLSLTQSLLRSRFVTYKINALDQRVQKTGAGQFAYSTTTTVNATTGQSPQSASLAFNARYMYDEQGCLIGEYGPDGKLIQETIWFDDLPVATLRPRGSNNQLPLGIAGTGAATANNAGNNTPANPVNVDIYYLHPDHLGTPRVATRSTAVAGATTGPNAINKAVWRWDSDPFGTSTNTSAPNGNPQNVTGTQSQIKAASFTVNNRFPGQVLDAESAKSYNYFRDYDSSIGRYTTSDPIGLRGGINTFGYAMQSPARYTDPRGLDPWYGDPGLDWRTKPGIPWPKGPLLLFTMCLRKCLGEGFIITSTDEPIPQHPIGTPHGDGGAIDIRFKHDPMRALCCAGKCGAEFGLDEYANPSGAATGGHVHIQLPPGRRGGRGNIPMDCKPCNPSTSCCGF